HPTFLYESLWNLAVLGILLIVRHHKKFEGEVFLLYLIGYGIGRFWIEALRTDQLLIPSTTIAVSQVLAAVLVVVSAVILLVSRRKH
ncbi:MAG: prolipoprotein diacylglyceryl transferase family protein, partial [Lachnospiraceae bacterium]